MTIFNGEEYNDLPRIKKHVNDIKNNVAFAPPPAEEEVKKVKVNLAAGIGALFNKGKSASAIPDFTEICITENGISEDTVG